MKKLAHLQAGDLGEPLALAKINTLGLAAYMSPAGAPGHDLMVVTSDGVKSIEVKTRQYVKRESEISRWPVLMQNKGDADFFIFVAIDIKTMAPSFYLLNNEQVRACHSRDEMRPGSGNCRPAQVRAMVAANDFSALEV